METPKGLSVSKLGSLFLKIPPQRQVAVISTGIVLSTLALGWFAIQKPYESQKSQREARIQLEGKRTEVLSTLAGLSAELKKIRSTLLMKGGTPALTRQVTDLASQAGVEIDSVSPLAEASFGPYTRVQIRVVAASSYAQLMDFLRLMERHEPLLKIDELKVGGSSPDRKGRGASAKLSVPTPPQAPGAAHDSAESQSVQLVIGAFSQRGSSP
ncbi:MAG: hypothetical protein HYS71_01595 [Candidatus Omnitrophica bacterium]|nr:hypothetical protein [Candidatus Omnitrophota bacterium]